jgi:hypothetical protein
MKWMGPYTIDQLLDSISTTSRPRPPEADGVYLISQKAWTGRPSIDCIPLYVGSNTGQSKRFRTRIGDLIADTFGFFGTETGHHSGGQTLHRHCKKNALSPKDLYIAWREGCGCVRCMENRLYDELRPRLNRNRPARCKQHRAPQRHDDYTAQRGQGFAGTTLDEIVSEIKQSRKRNRDGRGGATRHGGVAAGKSLQGTRTKRRRAT